MQVRYYPDPTPTYRIERTQRGQSTEVTAVRPGPAGAAADGPVVLRSGPELLAEGPDQPDTPGIYEETLVRAEHLEGSAPTLTAKADWPGSETRTLVNQGPVRNRIDLTIVGDGYTAEQRDRFFADAQRLTNDLFAQTTFASYLPLFNVHAVYVPSNESGLTDTTEKDTALGLYRSPAGSKRGVMPGNSRAIEKALSLSPDTDYPILVANDDFYGGLGGRYAITTRSPESGSMVLRHELGHNFGNVGEEYDGGGVYRGANHSSSTRVPWQPWVETEYKPETVTHLEARYPWKNLNEGPITINLNVPREVAGRPAIVGLDISSVGWETPEDVSLELDGQPLAYEGRFTADRSFFRMIDREHFTPGRHQLVIRENIADGDNVLAAVRANAYPDNYDFTKDKVGAFPTFDQWGSQVGYRPTHDSCLMRDMESTEFCAVDKENMWHQFLKRVNLIDAVAVSTEPDGRREVRVETPDLEGLSIRWFRAQDEGEVEIESLRDQTSWAPAAEEHGSYRAEVTFVTPEVRRPDPRFTCQTRFSL